MGRWGDYKNDGEMGRAGDRGIGTPQKMIGRSGDRVIGKNI